MTERERKEQALRMVRPLQRPTRVIYVWSWPEVDEWRLPKPGSRIADQVLALGAVPAEGSTVEVAGKRWQVMNALPRLLPIPPWLAEVVGGRRIGSRGKTARWVEMTTG